MKLHGKNNLGWTGLNPVRRNVFFEDCSYFHYLNINCYLSILLFEILYLNKQIFIDWN